MSWLMYTVTIYQYAKMFNAELERRQPVYILLRRYV